MNDETPSITDLPESGEADLNKRMRVYLFIMAIRVAAFLLVLVVPGWWKVLPAVVAVFSSWFAVIIANAAGMFSGRSSKSERPMKEIS
ncbi:DUF3099 domain-containing protein [Agrococcus casei]